MKLTKLILTIILLLSSVNANAQRKGAKPTSVIISEVKLQDFSDNVEALGTLSAIETVDLAASITEIVTKIRFDDNKRVKKGDVLLEMDISEEKAELNEQKSFIEEAQKQITRLKPLVRQGAASVASLDQSKRALETAKARMGAIKARINQRIIKAPFDGVLGLRNISVGSLVQPNSIITTLDDDSIMKLDFSVSEIFISTLKKGVIIKARTDAYPNKVFEGKISNLDSRIDPTTRSIKVRALIKNDEALLKPGLLMNVTLQENPRKSILIPEESLIANADNNSVFVINKNADGKNIANKRKVKIGSRQFGEVEILSGLQVGEKIVIHGILKVSDNKPVEIIATQKNNESLRDILR